MMRLDGSLAVAADASTASPPASQTSSGSDPGPQVPHCGEQLLNQRPLYVPEMSPKLAGLAGPLVDSAETRAGSPV